MAVDGDTQINAVKPGTALTLTVCKTVGIGEASVVGPKPRRTATPLANGDKWRHPPALSEFESLFLIGV